ncbi:MAG: ParB/RepB/Spo0J family partition protein [Candidatus Komeilibacteria bacterium]|nr:ParB/RepB/Spo0J family partition protein [Candidatus Komeilibacteria bacterium]
MLKGGLGRGLSSLIPQKLNITGIESDFSGLPQTVAQDLGERVKEIELGKIAVNPHQPRENFDHGDLEDLVNSIKKHGILQPLIAVDLSGGQYQLVAGERRLRAAQILELKTVPCLVRKAQEQEQLELALIENLQRSDLNCLEEARAYKKLMEEFNLTQEEVGIRVGKKRPTIANALRLLDLPQEIQTALKEGRITGSHAKVILSAETEAERLKLFHQIVKLNLTVNQSAGEVRRVRVKGHERIISKDLETAEQEDGLRLALGTRVSITKKGTGGTIAIDFYSTEELSGIIGKIVK